MIMFTIGGPTTNTVMTTPTTVVSRGTPTPTTVATTSEITDLSSPARSGQQG